MEATSRPETETAARLTLWRTMRMAISLVRSGRGSKKPPYAGRPFDGDSSQTALAGALSAFDPASESVLSAGEDAPVEPELSLPPWWVLRLSVL